MIRPSAGVTCLLCNRSVLRRERHTVTQALFEANPGIVAYIQAVIGQREILFNNTEHICRPCWHRGQRAQNIAERDDAVPGPAQPRENSPENQPQQRDELADNNVLEEVHPAEINISELTRSPNTSNSCLFYRCPLQAHRRIPERVKVALLMNNNYYVPPNARACDEHLRSNDWQELFNAPNSLHDFNSTYIMDIFNILKRAIRNVSHMEFDNLDTMHPDELFFWTGRTHEEFNLILNETPSLRQRCKKPNKALGMYLTKLRSGESDDRLSVLFGISRRHFERQIHLAEECLLEDFVPNHLGFDHMNRQQVVNRNLLIPTALFGDPGAPESERRAIAIADGTYQNVQKSSNFSFQRQTYSPHKFRNLLKPLLLICSDGYIINVYGPFPATKSDAVITQEIMNDEDGVFHWFFREGDMFILDRGFRDALPDLHSFGYRTAIPESKSQNETQLTTLQANKSRKVTICRWVVEAVIGRFKRDYKLLRQDYVNISLEHLMPNFKIAAALINAFHPPVQNSIYAERFIAIINQRTNTPNNLAEYVIAKNLNRQRVRFQSISGNIPELARFPRLTQDDLILFAIGTYQLKLARSYYSEHARNGIYHIEVFRDGQPPAELERFGIEQNGLILLRSLIQSRHVRSRKYYTYIMYKEEEGLQGIQHYYCSCIIGKRTVGCCAHIMSVVWYLGWARYEDIEHPAAFLDNIL